MDLFSKSKSTLRNAAGMIGEAGQTKLQEMGPQAATLVKEITKEISSETETLTGKKRKKAMKKLVLARIRMPFFVKWFLSPLVGRAVGLLADYEHIAEYVRGTDVSPESRKSARAVLLKRLGAPFYLRRFAGSIVDYALEVVADKMPPNIDKHE